MFKKVLVANRGEIAVRVIRACRDMGIKTVLIHSAADKESMAALLADETYNMQDTKCYLDLPKIMEAAKTVGADAIHPGYGFLSENAGFPKACREAGITFIGPSEDVIKLMGDKAKARELAIKAGVPVVPGSPGPITSVEEATNYAKKIGYPVILKAAAGGGGRGMRVVNSAREMENALEQAKAEALLAFKNDTMLLEKYLLEPRHVEIQLMADMDGNVLYLPERDCSVQRRHQKLVEESPSPAVKPVLRKKIGSMAAKLAKEAGYHTVGTVEFLLDKKGAFYFMEMNTRIQVEHPVTEMVTGIDLVKEQLKLAAGLPLTLRQKDIQCLGWAIECRINAEDPAKDFQPRPGRIEHFEPPGGPGVRVEVGVYQGWTIPPLYDSLLAKLIVWGIDRDEACRRMDHALAEFKIKGVPTTIPFHRAVMTNEFFRRGEVYTNFLETHMPNFGANMPKSVEVAADESDEEVVAAIAGAIAMLAQAQGSNYRIVGITPAASNWKLINRQNAVLSRI
ncbi:MAG: acetyl-CoA carboxylase biotin carboxylase subunit [Peptococcaceae bacterium]|nr:acetyl-CoA carboxylase biotin carboxylase subunit [Peptococcaceae bacterium]